MISPGQEDVMVDLIRARVVISLFKIVQLQMPTRNLGWRFLTCSLSENAVKRFESQGARDSLLQYLLVTPTSQNRLRMRMGDYLTLSNPWTGGLGGTLVNASDATTPAPPPGLCSGLPVDISPQCPGRARPPLGYLLPVDAAAACQLLTGPCHETSTLANSLALIQNAKDETLRHCQHLDRACQDVRLLHLQSGWLDITLFPAVPDFSIRYGGQVEDNTIPEGDGDARRLSSQFTAIFHVFELRSTPTMDRATGVAGELSVVALQTSQYAEHSQSPRSYPYYTGAAGRLLPFMAETFASQLNELDQARAEPRCLDIIDCFCTAKYALELALCPSRFQSIFYAWQMKERRSRRIFLLLEIFLLADTRTKKSTTEGYNGTYGLVYRRTQGAPQLYTPREYYPDAGYG
ncbi:uncharacterized protein CLUP02_14854 [Colletotrichum lupini]|uniref:Uncharacterized protein n=1 Tax=Colletotrichum lupini TaxID=145971 RepID=A0A9Q8T5D5_9PEZI|nr:uncharacterized protein CLUP02_14854 [Colletotrichum lupini]UQC89325.1 hypothetical protein CLUP02_14854 [Colletotrichum lupini]